MLCLRAYVDLFDSCYQIRFANVGIKINWSIAVSLPKCAHPNKHTFDIENQTLNETKQNRQHKIQKQSNLISLSFIYSII